MNQPVHNLMYLIRSSSDYSDFLFFFFFFGGGVPYMMDMQGDI